MAVGKAVKYHVAVAINQDLKALVTKETLDNQFLLLWLSLVRDEIAGEASGSTVMGVSTRDLRAVPMKLPALAEQRAIAAVLSDMEDEIAALERRREKARAIKQGMMQSLLTGRMRVVPSESSEGPKA
jgi:type I restriction enzyme S subunit